MALGQWGPALLGKEEYEKERETIEKCAHVYGEGPLSTEPVVPISLRNNEPGTAVLSTDPLPSTGAGLQAPPAPAGPSDIPPGFALDSIGGGRFRVVMPSGSALSETFRGRQKAIAAIHGIVDSVSALMQSHEPTPEPEVVSEDAGAESVEPEVEETPQQPVRPEAELTAEAIEAAVQESDGSLAALSISALKEMVDGHPELVGRQFAHELNRPEGRPRKGALDALLAVELQREGGPHAAMQSAIEAELHALKKG